MPTYPGALLLREAAREYALLLAERGYAIAGDDASLATTPDERSAPSWRQRMYGAVQDWILEARRSVRNRKVRIVNRVKRIVKAIKRNIHVAAETSADVMHEMAPWNVVDKALDTEFGKELGSWLGGTTAILIGGAVIYIAYTYAGKR